MRPRRSQPLAAALASLAFLPDLSSAFYLPGVAPSSYDTAEPVPLNVNSVKPGLSAQDARLHSVISYDYYNPLFQFCQPDGGPKYVAESLGSILFGDRIMTSPFVLRMATNESCNALCSRSYAQDHQQVLKKKIEQGYNLNWLVDGLPAGQQLEDPNGSIFYSPGFGLGSVEDDGAVVFHNHYDIYVEYHESSGSSSKYIVVGVTVEPDSRAYTGTPDCRPNHDRLILAGGSPNLEVTFTYSVTWIYSPTAWATRWDKYLHVFDPKIHWFWLVDTAIIVIILAMTVASILVRTLRKDIARYNRLDQLALDDLDGTGVLEEGVQEDSGWKLVYGDVFRNPSHPLLLSVLLGNGAQLFVMTAFTIVFALLGFLSPSNRGSLGSIMILLYTILGFVGGYASARVYKSMGGEKWKLNIALTPTLVPGVVFSTFFLLDLFLWARQSSGAVPFSTMLVIIAIWFVISIPLSVLGSFLGFRAASIDPPVKTNQIPRQIPPSTFYMRPIPSMLIVGLLPFGAIFVELYFIMNSIWFNRIYYMFGFLFLCYVLMIVTCSTVTILLVYFLLCSENYNWQWRAFLAAGTSGVYIFLNCIMYLITKLQLSGLSGAVIYIGYSALISFLFFILTGTIGYFSSWWFTRKIYASLKID